MDTGLDEKMYDNKNFKSNNFNLHLSHIQSLTGK